MHWVLTTAPPKVELAQKSNPARMQAVQIKIRVVSNASVVDNIVSVALGLSSEAEESTYDYSCYREWH